MGEQKLTINITGGGPWGLRLQGGKDFGAPLTIARVTPQGKADRANVRPNDIITAINGQQTTSIAHLDAQNLVKSSGSSLQLEIVRGRDLSAGSFPSSPSSSGTTSPSITSTYKPTSPGAPVASPTSKVSFQASAPAVAALAARRSTLPRDFTSAIQYRDEPDTNPNAPRRGSYQSPIFMKVQAATGDDELDLPPPPPDLSPGEQITSPSVPSATFNKLQSQLESLETNDEPPPPPSWLSSGQSHPAQQASSPTQSYQSKAAQGRRSSSESAPPPNTARSSATLPNMRSSKPAGGSPEANLSASLAKFQKMQGQKNNRDAAVCGGCHQAIQGTYVTALGKQWHPDHFVCSSCGKSLRTCGFMEDKERLFCEKCYVDFFASRCDVCKQAIQGESVSALNKTFHSKCFRCARCSKPLAGAGFHVEDGLFYCKEDYEEMFSMKCKACNKSMSAGETWLEALDAHWHEDCFVCTMCKVPLHGGKFYSKLGRPYCKTHA